MTPAHGTLAHAVAELATAGYSVAEALRSATSDAADACGLRRTAGRLLPGYDADLLVVDGDAAADLTALARPLSVWVQGVQVSET
jgi:imidazolonepropionase-like amidohydrolase